MRDQTSGFAEHRLRLPEVLLGYLRAAGLPPWPGADGLMLEEIRDCYPHAAAAGLVPGREDLLLRHAEERAERLPAGGRQILSAS